MPRMCGMFLILSDAIGATHAVKSAIMRMLESKEDFCSNQPLFVSFVLKCLACAFLVVN